MLVPGAPSDPFQIIDVRDLADFMRVVVEKHLTGAFNLCNTPRSVTMGSVLDTSKRVTGRDTRFTWATPAFLEAQGLIGKDLFAPSGFRCGPRPTAPTGPCRSSVARVRSKRVSNSARSRLPSATRWRGRRRGRQENQTLRTGLKPEQEAEALAKLHG
jgi:2'-hydroxyisoflavone reductase